MSIEAYLEDLERRIDPEIEAQLFGEWVDFLAGRTPDGIFSPRRRRAAPAGIAWPAIRVNAAFEDIERMALRELAGCSAALAGGTGGILAVRCNYGTGIMPSLFGAELFMMDDAADTLPTSVPFADGAAAVAALLDRGVPDVRAGLGGKAFAMVDIFQDLFRGYPKLQRHVHLYHPDLQGPMDVSELLWGSALYTAVVDHPGLVKDGLSLIADTYIRFMREWEQAVPFRPPCAVHWSMAHKGRIMLRDDSAMNFSPAMFAEFIAPYDQRLLAELGGGALHFCGRGDHYIAAASAMRGLSAVTLSQPDWNDMDTVFRHTVDKGIKLLGLARPAAEAALAAGRDLHGHVHCW